MPSHGGGTANPPVPRPTGHGAVPPRPHPERSSPMAADTTADIPLLDDPASPGAVSAGTRRLGLALIVISMAQLMLVLDELIVNTALPHIQRALHFSGA